MNQIMESEDALLLKVSSGAGHSYTSALSPRRATRLETPSPREWQGLKHTSDNPSRLTSFWRSWSGG